MFGQLTGMAMSIVNLPSVITVAMSMSLVPAISEAFALGNKVKARKRYKECNKSNITYSFTMCIWYGFTCNTYNAITISKRTNNCRNYTFIPYTMCSILRVNTIYEWYTSRYGKPMIPVIALVVGMISKIVISYTLTAIPSINVLGSAIGTVSAYFIAVLIELACIKKAMGVKFPIKEFIIRPLITVITMFIAVKLSYVFIAGLIGGKLATLISIAIGGVVYGLVLIGIGGIKERRNTYYA